MDLHFNAINLYIKLCSYLYKMGLIANILYSFGWKSRAIWGWDDSYPFIGNMIRGVDVISTARRVRVATLQSPNLSGSPCRFDTHPYQIGMLAGATSGGQVYTWTTTTWASLFQPPWLYFNLKLTSWWTINSVYMYATSFGKF